MAEAQKSLPTTKSQIIRVESEYTEKMKGIEFKAVVPDDYQPDLLLSVNGNYVENLKQQIGYFEKKFKTDTTAYRPPGLDAEIYHRVGEGSIGTAIAAIREIKDHTGKVVKKEKVVMKRFNLDRFTLTPTRDYYTSMLREFQNLQYLAHDNIAEMKDSFWSLGKDGNLKHVWIVTERMDFTLDAFSKQRARNDDTPEQTFRDQRELRSILVQILRALDYLHQRGIMHRDVKPANIGINKDHLLKLFDFGVARPINTQGDLTKMASTPLYHPLEVQLEEQYDCGIDIWATGLVALNFLNHNLYPQTVTTTEEIKQRILDVFGLPGGKYQEFFKKRLARERLRDSTFDIFLTEALERLGPKLDELTASNLKDLLSQMLCINPRRPLASELLNHDYLREANTALSKKVQPISANDHQAKNERDKKILLQMLLNFSRQL